MADGASGRVSVTVNCTTPPIHEPGPVDISISLDGGVTYTRREQGVIPLAFTYWEPPLVHGISPDLGQEGSGTIITIRGLRFSTTSQYSCEFDNYMPFDYHLIISQQCSASVIGPNELMCISPTILSHGIYKLWIKVDGVYECMEENGPFYFSVYARVFLMDFNPTSGSVNGGTKVSLQGSFELSNYHNHTTTTTPTLWCRFGLGLESSIVPAAWNSSHSTAAICIPPPAPPPRNSSWQQGRGKDVVLSVSFNRQDWVEASADQPSLGVFHYMTSPSSGLGLVFGLFPTSGPWEGGTTVMLDINPGSPRGDALCRFGGEDAPVVYGQRFSINQVACISPPMSKLTTKNITVEPMTVMVWISFGDCGLVPTELQYTYTEPITISSVYPTTISGSGSTSTNELTSSELTVFGEAFPDVPALSCRLGGKGSTVQPALWISSHVIKCPSLIAQGFKPGDSGLLLEVTGNGVDYFSSSSKSNLLSIDDSDLSITRTHPTAGPSTGGWIINLEGSGFGPGLHCLFEGASLYGIEAKVQSPGHALCISPPHVPGNATLIIRRFPSTQYIMVGLHFFYPLEIVELAPYHGPGSGGTHLHVYFSKFTPIPETLLSSLPPHDSGCGNGLM